MCYRRHLPGGTSSRASHPTTGVLLAPKIQARIGTLIFPAASPTI